jgi:hypothetical protein
MSQVSDLNAAVHERLPNAVLVQLTRYNQTDSATVNEAVLNVACADAIGQFRVETGADADLTNYSHVAVLVIGVKYYLETYKGRESNIEEKHRKAFLSGCKAINERRYVLPETNSTLEPSKERAGNRPDMDRTNSAFWGGRTGSNRIKELTDYE